MRILSLPIAILLAACVYMLASIRGEAADGPGADIGRVIHEMIPKAQKFHV